jgi:hypothetical protein
MFVIAKRVAAPAPAVRMVRATSAAARIVVRFMIGVHSGRLLRKSVPVAGTHMPVKPSDA